MRRGWEPRTAEQMEVQTDAVSVAAEDTAPEAKADPPGTGEPMWIGKGRTL